jgi:hypothetical protein
MPLNRLAASTKWEEIDHWATQMQPVLEESIRNAA